MDVTDIRFEGAFEKALHASNCCITWTLKKEKWSNLHSVQFNVIINRTASSVLTVPAKEWSWKKLIITNFVKRNYNWWGNYSLISKKVISIEIDTKRCSK